MNCDVKCGLRENFQLRPYQTSIVKTILNNFNSTSKNIFVSLPQGSGKTIIALSAVSSWINSNSSNRILVLLPRRSLVDQWVERVQDSFYGLDLMKNPTLSREEFSKIRGWLKYSTSRGIAMTANSFSNYVKKGYFSESDFDLVIIDEASDCVVAKDFVEGLRMSAYLEGLEKWDKPKLFLLPYHVKEEKIQNMMKRFGADSMLIREEIKDDTVSQLKYKVHDPIIIDDSLVDEFSSVLDKNYRKIRINVNRILTKHGVGGHRENLETLLTSRAITRLKKVYRLHDSIITQIQTLITKYVLIQHLKKWFLYSNRDEISRSILSSQKDVVHFLSYEDKKLLELAKILFAKLKENKKIYIFSQYVATTEIIGNYVMNKLQLTNDDVIAVTGQDEDQYLKLEKFKKSGKILISTPVFDKGTDIPEADVIIIYTPPMNRENLFQVAGRIRGGEVIFIAYRGYEESIIKKISSDLSNSFNKKDE